MRAVLIASAAAAALLLTACGRGGDTSAANQAAPGNEETAALDNTTAAETASAEPATPEDAVQSAQALDQSAASAPAAVASYSYNEGGAAVRAVEDPGHGMRLQENGRSYFYRPGETTPYLVRDGDYAYAYTAGRLTGVLDKRGHRVDDRTLHPRQAQAQQALARARQAEQHRGPEANDHDRGGPHGPDQAGHDQTGHDHRPDARDAGHGPGDHAGPAPADHHDTGHTSQHHGHTGAAKSGPDDNHDQISDREEHRPGH